MAYSPELIDISPEHITRLRHRIELLGATAASGSLSPEGQSMLESYRTELLLSTTVLEDHCKERTRGYAA